MNDWEEFEEKMNLLGIDIGEEARKNIKGLQILKDIAIKEELGEISPETARKAALSLYEWVSK